MHLFVETLGLGRFHLAGHSMGGHIAGLYAHAHPERLQSLALVTNSGVASPKQSYLAVRAAEGEMILIPRTKAEFQRLIEVASNEPPFIPWPVGAVLAAEAVDQADFRDHILGMLLGDTTEMLEPVLPTLDMPIFVLWGRHDRLIDVSTVDVMQELKPDATYVILEDSGHLPIIEQPGLSAGHYRAFLAETAAKR